MTASLAFFLGLFLLLLLLGMPVAWSMGIASVAWILGTGNLAYLPIVPERIYQGMDVFVLMAIPLFILAGELINEGKITQRLTDFANLAFGWMRGGLAQVNIGASILFSGITGVALGDIAALGKVFIPAMTANGYRASYAAAVTAASSIIGPMVPPSLIVVIYSSVTGVSVGALFAACVFPGLLIGLVQMLLVAGQARRYGFARVEADRSPRALAHATGRAAPPLLIPAIILAGILGGVMTPTEAGAAAALYALALAVLAYRALDRKALAGVFSRSALFSGQLIIIVGCGALFSWVMAFENVPNMLSAALADWQMSPAATLLLFNLFLLLVGMFIDPTAAIILFAAILSKAAATVGVDPVHFGAVMILNLNIGLLTPPLGVCLFAAEKIANCGLPALIRSVAPFLAVNIVALAIVTYLPQISLWLPRALGF